MGRYALIIGTDTYTDEKLSKLKTPTADARAMAKALANKNLGGFDRVRLLINKKESYIRVAIADFLDEKKPDDLVLIYFSGHGVKDSNGHLYLALKDTNSRPTRISATALPSKFVIQQLDVCRSKKQILILDCCYSGAFARGTGTKSGDEKAVTRATFEGEGVGRVVLTASDETQFALEGDQALEQTGFSLFTHFLLDGLKTGKADQDNDGFISLSEWYEYTYDQVRSVTERQSPQKWIYRQQGDLRIAKNPYLEKKAAEVPADLLKHLDSIYADVRVGAVRELGNLLRSHDQKLAELARSSLVGLLEDVSDKVKAVVREELEKVAKVQSRSDATPHAAQEKQKTRTPKKDKNRIGEKESVGEKPITQKKSEPARKKPTHKMPKRAPIVISLNKIMLSNGMELMRVTAGTFLMGEKETHPIMNMFFADYHKHAKPQHVVNIPYDYWMARFPVTNELYNAFVKAERVKHPVSGWEKKRNHPVLNISWRSAMNYCKWLNDVLKAEIPSGSVLRLPTEAEWEKAARGTDGREYPWGNTFDNNKCNAGKDGADDTTSVGWYSPQGDSPYGCADMVGNVWEWTHTVSRAYPYNAADGREEEGPPDYSLLRGGVFDINFDIMPKLKPISYRVVRGGAFDVKNEELLVCYNREAKNSDSEDWVIPYYTTIGFRVVAAPKLS